MVIISKCPVFIEPCAQAGTPTHPLPPPSLSFPPPGLFLRPCPSSPTTQPSPSPHALLSPFPTHPSSLASHVCRWYFSTLDTSRLSLGWGVTPAHARRGQASWWPPDTPTDGPTLPYGPYNNTPLSLSGHLRSPMGQPEARAWGQEAPGLAALKASFNPGLLPPPPTPPAE